MICQTKRAAKRYKKNAEANPHSFYLICVRQAYRATAPKDSLTVVTTNFGGLRPSGILDKPALRNLIL
jgi:hypothetical protein